MEKDWKDRLGVVFSTNPKFNYEHSGDEEAVTLPPSDQKLRVRIDRKKRNGKIVTLVEGFVGTEDDLKKLAKILKNKCGVGGSAKEGEIILQGEHVPKVREVLRGLNYSVHG